MSSVRYSTVLITLCCLLLSPALSFGHDLWITADNFSPQAGYTINANICFGHNFPYFDMLITKDRLSELFYITPEGIREEITNTREQKDAEGKGALAAEVTPKQIGTYIISASVKRKGTEKQVASEKYAKLIISVQKETSTFKQKLGHRLEIVPLRNPEKTKSGNCLPVQILFEGKPLSTYVYATYEGYTSETEPFPITVKSNSKGVACLNLRPGIWMIQVGHKVDISATLTFIRK